MGLWEESVSSTKEPTELVDGRLGLIASAVDADTQDHMLDTRDIDAAVVGPFEQLPQIVEIGPWKALQADIWVVQLGDVAYVGITDDEDWSLLGNQDPLVLVLVRMLVETLVGVDPVPPVAHPAGPSVPGWCVWNWPHWWW